MCDYIVIEDGYNTDYIYSLILATCLTLSDGVNQLINTDTNNSNTIYIQEFIKMKFINPIKHRTIIEAKTINKFRIFLYHCGWLRDNNEHILQKGNIDDLYKFIFCTMIGYNLEFTKFKIIDSQIENDSTDIKIPLISIDEESFEMNNGNNNKKIKTKKNDSKQILNLSHAIQKWIRNKIMNNSHIFKFKYVPPIIPIHIKNIPNNAILNIMEGIRFDDCCDPIQKMLIWEINSLICKNKNDEIYVLINNMSSDWTCYSDKSIPSNISVNMENQNVIKQIMEDLIFVIYVLN